MKKALRIAALLLCLCVMLSACSSNPGASTNNPGSASSDNPGGSSDAPAVKEHTTLNIPMPSDATQLDPHVSNGTDYNVFCSIFDGLVRFDGSNQFDVIPDLAESWDISEDQMEFTFHLREAKWSDGSDFTADDVVFTIERMQTQPATASKVLMIKGAEKVDEHTVKILCNYAYPNLILQMASWPWRIVSKAAVEAAGDGVEGMVVGTGPYKLESWTPGVGVTLTRNEYYWGNEPYFEKITFKIITDTTTAIAALENGEIDMTQLINGLDVDYYTNADGFRVETIDRPGAYTVAFNTSGSESLSKKEVRQAFNYALDQEALVKLVYDGHARVNTYSIISEGEEGYTTDLPHYDYNVETAKQLLAEAGYPNGVTIKFTYPTTDLGERVAAAVKEMVSASGITLDLVPTEYSAYLAAAYTGDYESIYLEWQSVPYNPPLVYNLYFISSGSMCYCRTKDSYIDETAALAAQTLDDAARDQLYQDLNKHIRDEAYYAILAGITTNYGFNEHVKGAEYEPNTMITKFMDWYWE